MLTPVLRLRNISPPANGRHGVFTLGPIKCPTEVITDCTVSAIIEIANTHEAQKHIGENNKL